MKLNIVSIHLRQLWIKAKKNQVNATKDYEKTFAGTSALESWLAS